MYMNNGTMSNGPTIVDASSISTISVKEAIDMMKHNSLEAAKNLNADIEMGKLLALYAQFMNRD